MKIVRKFSKILVRISLVLLSMLVLYHQFSMMVESNALDRYPKNLIEVDDHRMNIHTQGHGKHTLVFLSGSATPSPVLDFKNLYTLLSDEYNIVVIEKFGYGFSDIVNTERSFVTMLNQNREGLAKAGISGPFILVPHSMSGLEAILWSQLYPEEVEAIIGLDMSLPRSYDNVDFSRLEKNHQLIRFARELGLVRLYYHFMTFPEGLTEEERLIYRAIASRRALNVTVTNEIKAISTAIKKIDSLPKPDLPMLLFVSNGKGTGVRNWKTIQEDYLRDSQDGSLVDINSSHYIHYVESEKISQEIHQFILSLDKNH